MNILIEGGYVVDAEGMIKDGAVVIEGNRIVYVGDRDEVKRHFPRGYLKIDAKDKIILPGLINGHTHIAMTLLRGYADDLRLQEWLENWIWPYEAKMSPLDIELGALLGSVESLLSGVTTVCSMYHYHREHNEASAAIKVGQRIVMGVAMFYWDEEGSIKRVEDALKHWHGRDELVRVSVSPHAPYTVSPNLWVVAEETRKNWEEESGIPVTITSHIVEDWNEPDLVKERFNVEVPNRSIYMYLDDLGVVSNRLVAAHSIHMNEYDYEVVSKRGAHVIHNPVANLKLGMGVANVPKMLDKGINVGLGTDGPASNNTLDMFETMKINALLHKGVNRDPTLVSARESFKMATINNALALGYHDLGLLKEGYLADILIMDYKRPNTIPLYNVYSHLVYAVRPENIDTVIVNGEVVVEKGVIKGIDVGDLIKRVSHRAYEIAREVGG